MILWLRHKRFPLVIIALVLVVDWFVGSALLAWELSLIREYMNK